MRNAKSNIDATVEAAWNVLWFTVVVLIFGFTGWSLAAYAVVYVIINSLIDGWRSRWWTNPPSDWISR